MNIGFFPNDALVQLFRCHITNTTILAAGSAALYRNVGIIDNIRDPEVSDACCALRCDQNVPLSVKTGLARTYGQEIMTAHWFNATVHDF